jgi:hypothetical protein
MLNIDQFRELIVKSTISELMLYSEAAEELLIFTCAVESLGGTYLQQVKGPALGIYQMEPATYNDIWQNYIRNNGSISMRMFSLFHIAFMPSEDRLIYDLRYATAMTRLHYARVQAPLPDPKNENAIWEYYKKYYNSVLGKAEKRESIKKYHSFLENSR